MHPPTPRSSHHKRLSSLLARAVDAAPLTAAIVHPCDALSLQAAVEAAAAGLITPILVGPEAAIRAAAHEAGLDIDAFRIEPAEIGQKSAALGVSLVRAGKARLLIKGDLHTAELLHEVVRANTGLNTGRRLSHVYILDAPDYARLLFVTDAVVNIEPTLEDKRHIVQNAIDLAHDLGVELPRVAILAAVELVDPAMRSTIDAAVLSKMAERGQIVGGVVDGPLAFDNAISPEAAREKRITSPVAGVADILVVPGIESGNMLVKQMTFLGGADAAGVVLGASAPIVLVSRADTVRTRVASCAVAVNLAAHQQLRPQVTVAGGAEWPPKMTTVAN